MANGKANGLANSMANGMAGQVNQMTERRCQIFFRYSSTELR